MPMANGTYVKVYLLGYKYAYDKDNNISVDNETIAKNLNMPLTEVLEAWDFWEGKGIIEKIYQDENDKFNYRIKFLNLKQLYIKNNYKPINTQDSLTNKTYTSSVDDLVEANRNPAINNMFKNIDYIMRRPLPPNEKNKKVLEWMFNYNMDPDIIEKAFFYGVEKKGRRRLNYIEGIIRNWYDEGITNVEALQEHLKVNNEKFYRYERVMKYLGRASRNPTESEVKVIDKWFDEYNFSMEMVLKGCENSKKTSNPSINYIDGILTSWYEKGIKSVEEIEIKDKLPERKEEKTATSFVRKAVPNRFHNFEQRTSKYTAKELEEIARRKREKYYFNNKGEVKDV